MPVTKRVETADRICGFRPAVPDGMPSVEHTLKARLREADAAYTAARDEFAIATEIGDASQIRAASERVTATLRKFAEAKVRYQAELMARQEAQSLVL